MSAWSLAVLIAGVYVAYGVRRSPVIRHYAFRPDYWGPFTAVRLVAIVMAIITGYFEELVFRKIFMDYAMTAGYGVTLQILFSAVTFGAAHAIWSIFSGKLRAVQRRTHCHQSNYGVPAQYYRSFRQQGHERGTNECCGAPGLMRNRSYLRL